MVESLTASRILLCVTHRTGYPLPFTPSAFGTQLTLSRIPRADANTIACSLVGASSLSSDLQQLIDDKTEGNPFFVEEVLRSLQERGLLDRRGDEVGVAAGRRGRSMFRTASRTCSWAAWNVSIARRARSFVWRP